MIVDESSMLDLALAERLLRSLPAGGRLVLLGDAQPAALGRGRARCSATWSQAAGGSGRVARLTRSWRMDPSDRRAAPSSLREAMRRVESPPPTRRAGAALGPRRTRAADARCAGAPPAELAFSGAELLLVPAGDPRRLPRPLVAARGSTRLPAGASW